MDEYITTKEATKLLGVTSTTLRRWDRDDKIQTIRTPSGIRMYNKKCIFEILGQTEIIQERRKIAYCRVSSKKQSNDLERQINFLKAKYPNHEIYSDIGSGISFKRKGLQKILELSMRGEVSEVVVSHRDRMCRFGFGLIEWIFNQNNTKLLVLDKESTKSSSKELANDVLSIIQIFTCKEMGKRRYKMSETKAQTNRRTE